MITLNLESKKRHAFLGTTLAIKRTVGIERRDDESMEGSFLSGQRTSSSRS